MVRWPPPSQTNQPSTTTASFNHHQHHHFFFFFFIIVRGEDSTAVRELGPFDFVICADLVYGGKEEAHRALLATLRELAADSTSSTSSPARHQMAIFFPYTPREVSREAVSFHRARRYFELNKVPPSTLPPEMQARGMEIFTFLPKELNN
jgi:hypothetical protein